MQYAGRIKAQHTGAVALEEGRFGRVGQTRLHIVLLAHRQTVDEQGHLAHGVMLCIGQHGHTASLVAVCRGIVYHQFALLQVVEKVLNAHHLAIDLKA